MKKRYIPWPTSNPGPWATVWLESVGQRDCLGINAFPQPHFFCTHIIGAGNVKISSALCEETIVGPGDLYSLWPGVRHQFEPDPPESGPDVELYWIRLFGSNAHNFMVAMGTSPEKPTAPARRPDEAISIIRELMDLAANYPEDADMKSVALLHELAIACKKPAPPDAPKQSLVQKVRMAMEQQVESGMGVEDFSRAFGISRTTLFLAFREEVGRSPIDVLTEVRIEHAKHLLVEGKLSIAQVAQASGFNDPQYFSRRFKAKCGVSPKTYQETTGNS